MTSGGVDWNVANPTRLMATDEGTGADARTHAYVDENMGTS